MLEQAFRMNNTPYSTECSILTLYKLCQQNLYFIYDGSIWRQKNSLGMGTNYSPSAVNITLWVMEFNQQNIIKKCIFFTRYIDDIFAIVIKKDIKMINFKEMYANYLNFDTTINENESNFLDLKIKIQTINNTTYGIETELYEKQIGSTQYIHYNSN